MNSAPIYVDSDDNKLKIIPGGDGATTEVDVVDVSSTQTLTGKSLTAPIIANAEQYDAVVSGGSAITVLTSHAGRTIALDTAAGTTATLPVATGSGRVYRFLVTLLATSNSHVVKVPDANHTIAGTVVMVDTDTAGTVTAFATASDSDTVTLNRSTTGSVIKGEWLEFRDIAANLFVVSGVLANTGNGATPFSATV
jgi:hypothetical protein